MMNAARICSHTAHCGRCIVCAGNSCVDADGGSCYTCEPCSIYLEACSGSGSGSGSGLAGIPPTQPSPQRPHPPPPPPPPLPHTASPPPLPRPPVSCDGAESMECYRRCFQCANWPAAIGTAPPVAAPWPAHDECCTHLLTHGTLWQVHRLRGQLLCRRRWWFLLHVRAV